MMEARPEPMLLAVHIARHDDPRLEDYRDIRDRDAAGAGARPGIFIGEQFLVVEKMLARPGMTRSILTSPQHLRRFEDRYNVAHNGAPGMQEAPIGAIPLYVAPPAVIEKIAGFSIHRGVLAIGIRPSPGELTLDRVLPGNDRAGPLTLLLCEEIRNMDNIGALFRNAAAFAIDAAVLSPGCHDPLYRKSIRVSIGHVLSMPWARSSCWPGDLARLKQEWGVTLIGASSRAGAATFDAIEPPQRVGILVGSEFSGLSPESLRLCDHVARIPMRADVDSLNVSTAAALLLHRFSRGQRV